MRFTQAYSGSTVCAPSRCVLMTGKHTGHSRVRGNKNRELPLGADEPTLGTVMKSAGYRTALFGKWGSAAPKARACRTRRASTSFSGTSTTGTRTPPHYASRTVTDAPGFGWTTAFPWPGEATS